ncbi:MAG TPA: PQQ-binding-like beta-propeller repeat protein [Candidatus Baltobacteraceae bacterium]|jgi:outer membrane protein assembly factor BamB
MTVLTLSGKTIFTKKANVTPTSPGCTGISGGTRCTVSGISLATGSYSAEITAYSRTKEEGQILSQAHGIPFTLKAGAPRKIAFTMDGVPTSFRVVPASGAVTGSALTGFTIGSGGVWGGTQTFLMTPLDADGDAIVGAGSPHLSVASSDSSFTVVQPVAPQQTFTITPPHAVNGATQLTLSASYADKSICSQQGAHCIQILKLTYAPFAADDWIAFAHDFQRTGSETRSTGITASTVSSLTQRWSTNVLDNIYSSPVVYNGNVIVATYGGIVYDLSALDGSVIWKTTISSNASENTRSSPMIDTADGLVFMGTWYAINGIEFQPQPSHFFALRLADGSVAWKTVVPGMIHDAPVYANGIVYEGWSGGDVACINGGVSAFDAKTGTVKWTWLTNPVNNPGGGGGVWGAIAWDGSHVVFGTGNTCQGGAWDQGAVALNTDGSMDWHFQADPTYTDDNDTGGGISIANGTDTFINKNGTLYTVDGTSGHQIISTPLGGVNGGHATPTTNGSTYVIGAGFFPASSSAIKRVSREVLNRPGNTKSGFISYLKAITVNGTVLWSIPMTAAVDAYAAIDNGVVYEGMDDAVDAISLQSGTILKQFPGAANFNAGPVVVPSGLYFADHRGFVYAYSLPQASSAIKTSKP